jgi:2-oxo-4-hydroxy-4-carboxy-5-ureidoimidazoline decarboxylase
VTRDEFLARFGSVFENRPDLAAQAWDRGQVDVAAGATEVHRAFVEVLHALPPDALTTFLNGHPDLAARSTRPGDLTPDSQREQGSAGLDGLDTDAGTRLRNLTSAYRGRFGFPFIMAVKGKQPAEILTALEARLHNQAADERAKALRQVERILLLRLEDRLGEA